MAALDATIGGVTSNSYVDITSADEYFAASVSASVWAGVATPVKEAALMEATRILDFHTVWDGDIADESQRLSFPRIGVFDSNRREYSSLLIPNVVVAATCELAKHLAVNGSLAPQSNPLSSVEVGAIKVAFDDSIDSGGFPSIVRDLVSRVGTLQLVNKNSITVIPVTR